MQSNLLPEERDKIGFYLVQNEKTLETYVGSGILGECERRHKYGIRNLNHHNKNVFRAVNRNPEDWKFITIPVYELDLTHKENRELAFDLEQEIIDEFIGNTNLFLNISNDARYCGQDFSSEHRAKISLANSKRVWTEESKIKASKSATGRKQSEETCRKKSESSMGRIFSEETRNKLSESKLGWRPPENVLNNLQNANIERSIAVMAEGMQYGSVNAAAIAIGVDNRTIDARCKSTTGRFNNYYYI